MGVIYFLARDDNRTLFELGKFAFGWKAEAERVGGILTSAAIWRALDDTNEPPSAEYKRLVTDRVLRWAEGKPVRVFTDAGYDWDAVRHETDQPYVITGTVYTKDAFPHAGDADYLRELAERRPA